MNIQEVQEFDDLFDFYWFENPIFGSKSISSQPVVETNQESQQMHPNRPSPSFVIRSFSDQNLSSMDSSTNSEQSNISPSSVLQIPRLETIQSGKEFNELEFDKREVGNKTTIEKKLDMKRERRRKKQSSKSLSELEIEELKGFMDLGFEFKDEDKDSNLVRIIPGLQRLGKEDVVEEKQSKVSRPYLSEAWNTDMKMKNQRLLMNWRLPATGDEMELKNHLKFWAQTIASNVR